MGNVEVKHVITEPIGILSSNGKRTLELNMISWNDKPPKYDLRRWQMDGNSRTMLKGITLDEAEARKLYTLLKARFEAVD